MVLLGLSLQSFAADLQAAAKIAPLVASQLATGSNTEALIVFSEQDDLSGAANLPTKLQKGQYVYNTLRTFAERSQAPIRKLLEQRGIPYQLFYGVNMIKGNAGSTVLYEVAARAEVARVEANPMVNSPVPACSLPNGTPGTGQPGNGARRHQQFLGLSAQRRMLGDYPQVDRRRLASSRHFLRGGGRQLRLDLRHSQDAASNLQQRAVRWGD